MLIFLITRENIDRDNKVTQKCVVKDLNLLNISLFMLNRGYISSIFSSYSEANASE